MTTTFRARYVFPIDGEPIENGSVIVDGGRIVAVGRQSAGPVRDFGNAAILPGLVNAHTHLDFSDVDRPFGEPGVPFVEWLRLLMAFRKRSANSDRQPMALGLRECIHYGTTLLGDITQPDLLVQPGLLEQADRPRQDNETGPTVIAFLEVIGPTPDRFAKAMALVEEHVRQLAATGAATANYPRCQAGLSPHAPYSVHPDLLKALVSFSASRRIPIAMHLAETPEELQLLRSGDGPLRIFLEELGVWNAAMLEPGRCPLDYLSTLVSAHRAIVVHGGCLDGEEIRFLAENQEHMGVVYCPRTHQWFGRRPYPLESMLAAGVPVALGTDGRGSSPDLNIMAEMRCVAQHHPSIPLPRILQMGTLDGASVLGCDAVTGSLTPGKQADLAVIALPRLAVSDPHDLLFHAEASFATCGCRGSA